MCHSSFAPVIGSGRFTFGALGAEKKRDFLQTKQVVAWEQGMPKEASAMGDGNPLPEVLLRRRCWCLKIAGYEGLPPWPYHAGSQKSGDGATTESFEGNTTEVGWKEAPAVALRGLKEIFFFLALKEGIREEREPGGGLLQKGAAGQ